MTNFEMILAGFGGQGLLFTGKVLAYGGLIEGKELSWLPSYGPEMRGGTASCTVILSDEAVGSPIVQTPNVLMVMNNPSFDKYEPTVAAGGKLFVDSTLVPTKSTRTDIDCFYVPATKLATEIGNAGLANMVLLGAIVKQTKCISDETLVEALHKVIPAKKADLFDINMKAIEAGKAFEA
ncbi:MAG: 2-oxoacid:acceptor oxidoreductase family protein [Clostridia bacterium]|nr:2-oxoacid:acceptor oxidoreductase family protein [Clostridia bacterium]